VRIGFRETKNLVMTMSVMKLVCRQQGAPGFDLMDYWYHSLACAVISQELALSSGYPAPEEAFVAGLLHDFGILVLHEFFAPVFSQVLEMATRHGTAFIDAEEELLRITDVEVAARLFQEWNLPPAVIFALRHHRSPAGEHEGAEAPIQLLNSCVGLGNLLAKVLSLGNGVDQCVLPVPDTLLEKVKLPEGITARLFEKVYRQVNLFAQSLNLDGREFPSPADAAEDNARICIAIADRNGRRFDPIATYLRLQGYVVEHAGNGGLAGGGPRRPDLLIVHARPDDTAVAIVNEIGQIGRGTPGDAQSESAPEIPAIVLHAPHSAVAEADLRGKVKLLDETADLRTIEMTIARLLGVVDEVKKIDELQVETRMGENAVRIFGLSGVVRVSTIVELKDRFMACLEHGTKYVALDLAMVEFIDSSGLGLIVNFFKRLSAAGGKLCLLSMSETVARLIEDVKLNKILPIAESEQELAAIFNLPPAA
jgi:anti-anti-sigma factor